MLGPSQALWTENAVKFELKLSNQMKKKNETKTKWKWSSGQNKNDINLDRMNRN